ncbi:HPr family phosphocarrier protein [Virgibacillus salexigens]|uniref:HPr family phosphocarrier protein n=1 Tax=Virgibacillus salexigens TaxID=61016 RepID=UPI003081E84B
MTIKEEQILCQKLTHEAIIKLVEKANEFDSNVLVETHHKRLNAKSILSMAMFGGTNGNITIYASGKDSDDAVTALKTIFNNVNFSNVST